MHAHRRRHAVSGVGRARGRRIGVTGRARERGLWQLGVWNPRDFATDNYRTVDDRPYGGGPGHGDDGRAAGAGDRGGAGSAGGGGRRGAADDSPVAAGHAADARAGDGAGGGAGAGVRAAGGPLRRHRRAAARARSRRGDRRSAISWCRAANCRRWC